MPFKQPRYNAALTRDNNARNALLAPSGGVYIPEEPDYSQFRNVPASEIEEKLLQKRALALTQGAPDVEEPDAGVPPVLAARVEKEGEVRMTPDEETAAYMPPSPALMEAFRKLNPPTSAAPVQTPPPAPIEAAPSVATATVPPAPPTPVAPSAAPAPAPQEDRLTQLARIVSMSQGQPQQTEDDRRRMAIMEALGKAGAAMNAGLTRTPVPANVFAPPTALMQPQTTTDRLEQLYKASQVLGRPGTGDEPVDALFILDLQRQFPNAKLPSSMTLSQFKTISDILNRERMEGGKTDRFKQAREQTAKQHTDRMDLAKQKMDKQEWQYVTSEIGDKQKQVAAIQSAMPVMQEVVDNSLAAYNLPGGEALRALRLGQFTPEQEQMWNVVFEQLVSPARKELFGATLTGNELAAFNVMVGLGPDASVSTKLNALRLLMKRMQGSLKGAFGGVQDTEAFQNYRNVTGDLTHLNPIWSEFDESLSEAAANAPKAGEAAAMAGERIGGAIKKAAKGAATTVKSALGGTPAQPRVQGPVAAPTPAPQAPTQKYTQTKSVGGKNYGLTPDGFWEEIEE